MPDVTVIAVSWHPDRTEPTIASASLQVDYSDGSQDHLVAGDDVSSKLQIVQDVFNALFQEKIK